MTLPFRQKVLVVDDDPAWVELMEDILRNEGYAVATAEDGTSALATISNFEPFVVITDFQMPGMDGMQLVARLHAQDQRVPVIILSGERSVVAQSQSLQGAFRVLGKFAALEVILSAVSEAAAHRASRLPLQKLWCTAKAHSTDAVTEPRLPAPDMKEASKSRFKGRLEAAVSRVFSQPLGRWALVSILFVSSAVLVRHLFTSHRSA